MRLFLQVNIGEWRDQGYVKPLLSFASSLADDILGTDLDDQSDPYVVNLVRELVTESERTFLLIYSFNQNLPLDNLLSLINHLHNHEDKVHLAVLAGEHTTLSRMLQPFEARFVKNSDDDLIRKMIRQFVHG